MITFSMKKLSTRHNYPEVTVTAGRTTVNAYVPPCRSWPRSHGIGNNGTQASAKRLSMFGCMRGKEFFAERTRENFEKNQSAKNFWVRARAGNACSSNSRGTIGSAFISG